MKQSDVIRYYDYTIPFYRVFWHKGTNALHYGFWEGGVRTHTDALINTNKVMADIANVKPGESVLDAGCGVGGSSLWLAKYRGASVTGITISPKQYKKAVQYANREGLENTVRFVMGDFTSTGFENDSFDVVWAIESVCHANEKKDFLLEAYRILKPGGRVVIADGFLRRPMTEADENIYHDFLRGFALENLAVASEFDTAMRTVGFGNVRMIDKSAAIAPTADFMRTLSLRWNWVHKLARKLNLIPEFLLHNIRTGIVQKEFFERVGVYAVFYGEKV